MRFQLTLCQILLNTVLPNGWRPEKIRHKFVKVGFLTEQTLLTANFKSSEKNGKIKNFGCTSVDTCGIWAVKDRTPDKKMLELSMDLQFCFAALFSSNRGVF